MFSNAQNNVFCRPIRGGQGRLTASPGPSAAGGDRAMSDFSAEDIRRVHSDPLFRELVRRRARLAWSLTALMIIIYFGFILAIAYNKALLSQPLAGGVTTVGSPLGIGVIFAAFILTGIYVARANSAFDDLTQKLRERFGA
jgi:uncharacterized membrane protein (DUF485 family)